MKNFLLSFKDGSTKTVQKDLAVTIVGDRYVYVVRDRAVPEAPRLAEVTSVPST